MTLHPRAQTQVGSGRSLKRLKRSCRRWQLNFATGLTRKVAPSACAKYLRYPRRSQDTPSSLELQIYRQVNYGVRVVYPQAGFVNDDIFDGKNYFTIQFVFGSGNCMNVRNLLIWLSLAGLAFLGWEHFHKDIQKTRSSLGISPNAVVMLWMPACGDVCLDQARQIKKRGIEVVNLDVQDGGAGTKLWDELGGGMGPFPTFLIGNEVFRAGQDGDLRSKLLSVYGPTALKSVEKLYFKQHFNADASSRAVLYTAEWCGYCKQLRSDLQSTGTPFTEIDVEKHYNPQELAEVMNIPGFPTVYYGYEKIEGDVSDVASQLRANLKK